MYIKNFEIMGPTLNRRMSVACVGLRAYLYNHMFFLRLHKHGRRMVSGYKK